MRYNLLLCNTLAQTKEPTSCAESKKIYLAFESIHYYNDRIFAMVLGIDL